MGSVKIKLALLLITASTVMSLFGAVPKAAAASSELCSESNSQSSSFLGFPTWYKYLDYEFAGGECKVNFDVSKDVPKVLLALFEILLRIAGIVAVVFVLVGGFQFILSQGEPDRAKAARATIINAVIGLVIALLATVIINFIARTITA